MAGIKISDLPAIIAPALSDVFPVDQGAVTYKVTNAQLLALFAANASGTWGINISGNAATATFATSAGSASTATNATNSVNVGTTANASNASFYPLFVASNAGGNQAAQLGTGLSFNPSSNTLTTTTFSGALNGNATTATTAGSATTATTATNANNVATTQVATNATFYPLFVASSANGNQVVDLGTGLTFNPSTNTLSTTTFAGALSGNATTATSATTATTATNANNVATTQVATNATFYPLFVSSSTNSNQAVDLGTGLTFNPSTNTLTTATFAGALSGNATTATSATTATTATNATNTAITDDTTTNATMYLTWVTAATGNLPQKVSSTKLAFNPSTGVLTLVGLAFNPTTGGITGTTTNNNADAGKVGEVVTASLAFASATALVNNTAKNVTSISLTAGDWDVNGNVYLNSGSTGTTNLYGWISTTSATFPDNSLVGGVSPVTGVVSGIGITAPYVRISVASTTTVYLSAYASFVVSCTASGTITARRAR